MSECQRQQWHNRKLPDPVGVTTRPNSDVHPPTPWEQDSDRHYPNYHGRRCGTEGAGSLGSALALAYAVRNRRPRRGTPSSQSRCSRCRVRSALRSTRAEAEGSHRVQRHCRRCPRPDKARAQTKARFYQSRRKLSAL